MQISKMLNHLHTSWRYYEQNSYMYTHMALVDSTAKVTISTAILWYQIPVASFAAV